MTRKMMVHIVMSAHMKRAADLCGLSPSQWATRRLHEAAVNDVQEAHVALVEARVRHPEDVLERERRAVEAYKRRDKSVHTDIKAKEDYKRRSFAHANDLVGDDQD